MEALYFSFKKAKFNHDYKEGVKTTVQKAYSSSYTIKGDYNSFKITWTFYAFN